MVHILFVLVLASTVGIETIHGAKILMIPYDHYSFSKMFVVAGEALVEAGHEVHLLTVPRHKTLVDRHRIKGVYFHPVNHPNPMVTSDFTDKIVTAPGLLEWRAMVNQVTEGMAELCHQMLADKTLTTQLATAAYDKAIVEAHDLFRCLMVIPYRHGIRYISVGIQHDPWDARVSSSPFAEGHCGVEPFADPYHPTMWERGRAFLRKLVSYLEMPPSAMSDDFITQYAPNQPAITMRELYQNSEIHFMDLETVCLDSVRVAAPHYIYIGGIGNVPAQKLTGKLENIVNNATDGLVVVTFGSAIQKIPMPRMEAMMMAFKQIPEQVVMGYKGPQPAEVPDNVIILKWLPQNDLLGHPNTRLFITHGGTNGQLEALYHGVPFISFPIAWDQKYNAQRGAVRGFGTMLNLHSFTADELTTTMRQIIDEPSYSEKIRNCSLKYKAMPSPKKIFTFWIEHVIKHGGVHLKSTYFQMTLWRWFDLDILFICFIFIHFTLHIIWFIIRYLFREHALKLIIVQMERPFKTTA